MTEQELKRIRQSLGWSQRRLAEATGVTLNSIARQERGELGISEPLARLIRLIAAGVDVEAIAHTGAGRRDSPPKSAQGSDPRNSQDKSRKRARKNSFRRS